MYVYVCIHPHTQWKDPDLGRGGVGTHEAKKRYFFFVAILDTKYVCFPTLP